MKGEAGAVNELEPKFLTAGAPELNCRSAVGGEAWGSIVIADGGEKGQASLANGVQHVAGEPIPHAPQVRVTEPPFLARHHVAGAHQQRRLKFEEVAQALMHRGSIGRGAVAAVQITDQADAQRGVGRRRHSEAWLVEVPIGEGGRAHHSGDKLQQLAAITAHRERSHRGAAWCIHP